MNFKLAIFTLIGFQLPVSGRQFLASSILTAIILISTLSLNAQITQPAIYEHLHKNSDHEFIIISMAEQGLALVRDTEKFEHGKKDWEVIIVDTTLNESWSTKIEIDERMSILGHDFRDGNVYLIFQEPEGTGRKFNLTEILFPEKIVKQHLFKPEVNMHFTHFSILKNKAIFGGYITKEPALLIYDLDAESAKVVPGIFQLGVQLIDVRVNSNDSFNVLMTERVSNSNRKIVVRTYDANGVMLVDDIIAVDEEKTILDGITSSLVHDELIVMGTWTYGSSSQAAGIFSVVVDPFNEQKINYYDFAELNHVLDYLKPKKVAKIKAKAEWRKSVGKNPEFRAHLSIIRMDENQNGFSLLTEVYEPPPNYYNSRMISPYGYYPYNYGLPYGYSPYGFNSIPYRYYNSPYGYNPYSPYSPYGPYSTSLADTRMLHSSLAFFDLHGKMISDNSLKYSEIKLNSKEQVSDFVNYKERFAIACKNEKEIKIQVSNADGTAIKEETIKPALKTITETARSESHENSGIRVWYDHCFYVYGYHTVRDNAEKTSRDVFYINKIKVD